jgi:hypothetical protein
MKSLITFTTFLLFQSIVFGQNCLNMNENTRGNVRIFSTTGVKSIDNYLSKEGTYLEEIFAVKVKLQIFDDSNEPNAYATSESINPLSFDGTVYFGLQLLADELKEANGYASVNGILAHEYGHILQEKLDCKLEGAQRELHADFMAGFYMGKRGIYTADEIKQFSVSLFKKGDKHVWDASHHGTPKKRLLTLLTGYFYASKTDSPSEAYYAGIKILSEEGGLKEGLETQSIKGPDPITVTTPDGKTYNLIYGVKYTVDEVEYAGLLLLGGDGLGKIRLRFGTQTVEESVTLLKKDGILYLVGSSPINPKTGRAMSYNSDIFFFSGDRMYVTDINLKTAEVKSFVINDLQLVNDWLKYLEW